MASQPSVEDKWWKFLELNKKALQFGSQISKPSEEVLSSLKMNVKLSLRNYNKAPTMQSVLDLGELKWYCTSFSVTLSDVSSVESSLWKFVSPSVPPPPEPSTLLSREQVDTSRCFAVNEENLERERLTLVCKQLATIQEECIMEGYSLDIPSQAIQEQALKQLSDWNQRATGDDQFDAERAEWRKIIQLLGIPESSNDAGGHSHGADSQTEEGSNLLVRNVNHNSTGDPGNSTLLEKVITAFEEKYVSTGCTSLSRIVHSVDSVIGKDLPLTSDTTVTVPPSEIASNELLTEMQCLREENEVLKAQLSLQIEELKKENLSLKERLQGITSTTEGEQICDHYETNPQMSSSNIATQQGVLTSVSEETTKKFNSFPKSLTKFMEQMEKGWDGIPKFSDLQEELRKSKRTKGSYCKRKSIYTFITNFPEGVQVCLEKFSTFTPLQLYEQHIKKSRSSLVVT